MSNINIKSTVWSIHSCNLARELVLQDYKIVELFLARIHLPSYEELLADGMDMCEKLRQYKNGHCICDVSYRFLKTHMRSSE